MIDVTWSAEALVDLGLAMADLAERSTVAATRFGDRITAATRRLELFPRSGRVISALGIETLREVVIDGSRLIYLVQGDRVYIVALRPGAGRDR